MQIVPPKTSRCRCEKMAEEASLYRRHFRNILLVFSFLPDGGFYSVDKMCGLNRLGKNIEEKALLTTDAFGNRGYQDNRHRRFAGPCNSCKLSSVHDWHVQIGHQRPPYSRVFVQQRGCLLRISHRDGIGTVSFQKLRENVSDIRQIIDHKNVVAIQIQNAAALAR